MYKLEAELEANINSDFLVVFHSAIISAMTSLMVVPVNMGKQFLGNWCSAAKRSVVINSPCNTSTRYHTNRRFSLLVSECSHCSPVVNTKNGMKDESTEDFVTFLRGRFVEDRFVYMQNFSVRSYEIGPDQTISMETLTNFLQVYNCYNLI